MRVMLVGGNWGAPNEVRPSNYIYDLGIQAWGVAVRKGFSGLLQKFGDGGHSVCGGGKAAAVYLTDG